MSDPDDRPDISLIVPVLDEAENLVSLATATLRALEPSSLAWELIFVDDGSQDGSAQVLEELWAEHPQVKVVQFRRNYGKTAAYAAGFSLARGEFLVTLDADGQDDPRDIPHVLAHLHKGFDLVVGWRRSRADTLTKRWASHAFNRVTRLLSGVPVHDSNCGLKVLRREVVEGLALYGELHRFVPALAHMEGWRVGELEVRHHPRRSGQTKYGWSRTVRGLLDLATVTLLGRYLERPLHLFGSVGALCGGVGGAILAYIALLRLTHGTILNRYPLLTLGLLLTVLGVQFMCTGLLAELITRRARPQPHYNLRRKLL